MQKVAVVVPCYNEAKRLDAAAFVAALADAPELHFVFVNDGSTDETGALLDTLCARAPARLSAVHLARNVGKANAVRAGMELSLATDAEIVGYLDADLATPLGELSFMLAEFSNPHLYGVLGSRAALLGRRIERSVSRHYLGRLFASAASCVLGLEVYDTQCGAKLFRAVPGVREVFAEPFATGWAFDVEILARLKAAAQAGRLGPVAGGLVEYPLRRWADVAGSKLRATDFVRAGLALFQIWRRYR